MTDPLRSALADSANRRTPRPAPVVDILRAGRARRTRRRAGLAATAACAVAAAVAVPLTLPGPQVVQAAAGTGRATASSVPAPQTVVLGKGAAGGRTWWVLAVYYPVAPSGCSDLPGFPAEPALSDGPSSSGAARNKSGDATGAISTSGASGAVGTSGAGAPTAGKAQAKGYSAFTVGASTDGRTIAQLFECEANPSGWHPGSTGMYGDRGLDNAGSARVFTGQPAKSVVSATMTLSDGSTLTTRVALLPGSKAPAYAFVVPGNLQEKSLDEYNAQHHLVSHQNL
ncbi:hypothetical protein [Streptacidiphilus carbonis]|uniref:hypothetical protein n=1 Tax=Streptacidiphilus carbonis TaxID=105422 RepID=UPI0005A65EF6|nr:hypothetical protein [Streptacidiphilus carbonis]